MKWWNSTEPNKLQKISHADLKAVWEACFDGSYRPAMFLDEDGREWFLQPDGTYKPADSEL